MGVALSWMPAWAASATCHCVVAVVRPYERLLRSIRPHRAVRSFVSPLCRQVNRCIQVLDLSDNVIQDEGAVAIARAIQGNTVLTELSLASNGITSAGPCAQRRSAPTAVCHILLHG